MKRLLTLVLTLTLALPALAHGALRPGDGLRMAEQRVPSPCAGHTRVIDDPAYPRPAVGLETVSLPGGQNVGGLASGLEWTGTMWHTARCEIRIAPVGRLSAQQRCMLEIHEYLHLAFEQSEHTGLLSIDWLESTGRDLCTPSLTIREQAIQLVRFDLPNPDSWTVRCSKSARRMSCRALRSGSRTRRFRITVARDGSMQSERAGKVSA